MIKNHRRMLLLSLTISLVAGGCAKKTTMVQQSPVASPPVSAVAKPEPKAESVTQQSPAPATSDGRANNPEVKPVQDAARLSAELQAIYFSFDSALLSPDARELLVKNAAILKDSAGRVIIEGHCDERGSDEYNLALGERRAKAAMTYLRTLGVPAERLTAVSYGREKPADPGHDEASWQKNRRGEFIYTP